jgi:hypothetical protein
MALAAWADAGRLPPVCAGRRSTDEYSAALRDTKGLTAFETGRIVMGIRRSLSAGAVAATMLVGAMISTAGTAQASAYGCTPYTNVRIKGISPANWCGGPTGSGRQVSSVSASFGSSAVGVGIMCNASMRVEIFNDRGTSVWKATTPVDSGCRAGDAFALRVNKTFPTTGHVETTLLSYGATKATLSHNIK